MTLPDSDEMPRLRGHHFICLQFFAGQGYSFTFVQNLRDTVASATSRPATLVDGPDDVCRACPGRAADGTCLDPNAGEIEVRRIDRLARELLGAEPGAAMTLPEARDRLAADAVVTARWRLKACCGCTWEGLCKRGWEELLGESEAVAGSAPASDPAPEG